LYARMRELSSKFEGVETVDVGTLSRRVRRENPDITSPLTNKRARQILSHFHRYLELRVSRRPRSFAKRVRKWAISKVGHHMSLCGYACSFKNLPRSHPTGAVRRVTTANPLELLSSPLVMETFALQSSHRFRRAFHSISHSARVWFLGGLVFCRIAVAVVVVCVEPRGPVSPIGVLDIQMTAVMRREFGTTEPPSSEVELGRGRANGLVHVHFLPPVGRSLFDKNIQTGVCFFLSKVM